MIAAMIAGAAAMALPSGEVRADAEQPADAGPTEGDLEVDAGAAPITLEAERDDLASEAAEEERVEPYDPFVRGEGAPAEATVPARPAAAEPAEASEAAASDPPLSPLPGDQEIGARVGVALGGRTSPGGLTMSGHYLYRLAGRDWFDGGVAFTFGSGREACFRDRRNEVVCRHGFASGFSAEVLAGVARYFGEDDEPISPFLRGGLGVRAVAFPGDELRGIAVPLWAGAGVRARVHDTISVVGGAELRAGPAWMTRGIGLEPHGSFAITAGVDFTIQ
jgi:hypothetical protein